MTFGESISTCFSKYATFEGRASRSEYWWFFLFTFLASIASGVVSETLSKLFSLAVLLPSLAVGARRLHDVDKSGWFLLLWLVPIVGWIVLVVWAAQEANGNKPQAEALYLRYRVDQLAQAERAVASKPNQGSDDLESLYAEVSGNLVKHAPFLLGILAFIIFLAVSYFKQ